MAQTQLLCTFATQETLLPTISQIAEAYTLAFNAIYVLENAEDPTQFVLTYNVVTGTTPSKAAPAYTISVHRKKHTNTIYTINALNALIAEKNGGVMDKTFKVDWTELQNTVLVTAQGQLKIIKTKLNTIINP